MDIREITDLSVANVMWKTINHITPRNVYEKLNWDETERRIRVIEPRLKFTNQDFIVRGCNIWNDLPDMMRENTNLGSFKRQMRTLMKERRQREPD